MPLKICIPFCCAILMTLNGVSQISRTSDKATKQVDGQPATQQKQQYQIKEFGIHELRTFDDKIRKHLSFADARLDPQTYIPRFSKTLSAPLGVTSAQVSVVNVEVKSLTREEQLMLSGVNVSNEFEVLANVSRAAGKNYLIVSVNPIRKSAAGGLERLVAFDLKASYTYGSSGRDGERSGGWKENSVLAAGQWYKLATGEDGIYKVNYAFLRDCGFDVDGVASNAIRLFGAPAGELSMDNSADRVDDLTEIPIYMEDGGDGVFDQQDYFLFYGEDQVRWLEDDGVFRHDLNIYSDSAFYFITTSENTGLPQRISVATEPGSGSVSVTSYDFYAHHEVENTNLIKSGRDWYGEQLGLVKSLDFGFFVSDVVKTEPATVRSRFAVRSVSVDGPGMTMSLPNQGGVSYTAQVDGVPSAYAQQYARNSTATLTFNPVGANFLTKMAMYYGSNQNAIGWIDYIELNARRSLKFTDPFMSFRDTRSVGAGNIAEFSIAVNGQDIRVWDVTDIHSTQEMKLSGNAVSGFKFNALCDSLREFVAFDQSAYLIPSKVGAVTNQNLHSLRDIEYVVVTHPLFNTYAEQMALMHEELDGYSTAVVNVFEIYNEFSGGAQDITAIKEFMRMLYKRGEAGGVQPKYLLLMGDASYDYKDRVSGNSNYVPSYQTAQSLLPTASIVSDDFFGLLDDDEGEGLSDLLDVATGRLPARSKQEAERMVDKIVHYATSPQTFGDWRNWVALVADDADPRDGFTFMSPQCNTIADMIDTLSPQFNVQKIYLDAYKQVSGSGGERYPDASNAIDERLRKGALMMYYVGHGGELGWAHERVLEVAAINKWSNEDNLPLFLTATCEFTRFDDPRRTSAGEYVMLNPDGGGVALLTTTRAVYSGPNFNLTKSFTENAFRLLSEGRPRLGDITVQTKTDNASANSDALNSRCFTLMGDPAMKLAFPTQNVVVTNMPDTIKALDKVMVQGRVETQDGQLIQDFNGLVYPTLFDKVSTQQTLNNDGQGVLLYTERKNILFRGKASVKNGLFQFEFVVPKDIDRDFGGGKLSLYAHNGQYDANGAEFDYTIGGLSDNPVIDDEGPRLDLFMNNNKFVFGGITDENPDLYAEVSDSNGINMVGSGIGHDITAVLDNKASNTLVLNDYYESDVDSYKSGKIRYPLSDMEEGRHTLKLQVWDVNNNPSESYTEFIVASDAELALEHVLNYPNPFTTNTQFYFEHNKPGQDLDVRIEVFSIGGKLIKTIDGAFGNDGYRIGPIPWNGRDDFGDLIGKGVYVYRVSVKTIAGEQAEKYEKLVILK